MQSNRTGLITVSMIAAVLLSSAWLSLCAANKNVSPERESQTEETDSVGEFVPTHPPVVVPHPWREGR